MQHLPQKPLLYLITSGRTTAATTRASNEYRYLIRLIDAAVRAKIPLFQIREKNLTDRTLYELSIEAAARTTASETRLLINDRADIARAAGAAGVHLTSRSMKPAVVRKTFGDDFLIGVSTHSCDEAEEAARGGADFVVFGPIFDTESKRAYGTPLGIAQLSEAVSSVGATPLIAIGGISLSNAAECFSAGAGGIAAIRLLNDPDRLVETVDSLRESFARVSDEH